MREDLASPSNLRKKSKNLKKKEVVMNKKARDFSFNLMSCQF